MIVILKNTLPQRTAALKLKNAKEACHQLSPPLNIDKQSITFKKIIQNNFLDIWLLIVENEIILH